MLETYPAEHATSKCTIWHHMNGTSTMLEAGCTAKQMYFDLHIGIHYCITLHVMTMVTQR